MNFFRTLGGAIIVAVFGAIVLGGGTDGSGVMTLEKIAAEHGDMAPAFHWVFIAADLHRDFVLLPARRRGAAAAWADAVERERGGIAGRISVLLCDLRTGPTGRNACGSLGDDVNRVDHNIDN